MLFLVFIAGFTLGMGSVVVFACLAKEEIEDWRREDEEDVHG